MSRDPYHEVKQELEQNLSATQSLYDSYTRISQSQTQSGSGSGTSQAVLEARDELRGTLALLEADLEDLEETVRAVEQVGDRWGLEVGEVGRRRAFVERVKGEVGRLRSKVSGGKGKSKAENSNGKGRYRDTPDPRELEEGNVNGEDVEEARRWEMEEQQTIMRRQDDTLGVISGTLHTLASQAGLIGSEVNEQSEMLDDLGNRVDNTDSRLRKVRRTMDDFIRRNEETKSGWCIGILIVVLIILLMLVILT